MSLIVFNHDNKTMYSDTRIIGDTTNKIINDTYNKIYRVIIHFYDNSVADLIIGGVGYTYLIHDTVHKFCQYIIDNLKNFPVHERNSLLCLQIIESILEMSHSKTHNICIDSCELLISYRLSSYCNRRIINKFGVIKLITSDKIYRDTLEINNNFTSIGVNVHKNYFYNSSIIEIFNNISSQNSCVGGYLVKNNFYTTFHSNVICCLNNKSINEISFKELPVQQKIAYMDINRL